MRTVAVLFCVLSSLALYAAETSLAVFVGEERVGAAKLKQTRAADGGVISQIELRMNAGGSEVTVLQINEYAADGTPRRKYSKQTSAAGVEVRVVTFRGATATLIIEKGGSTTTRSFSAPAGAEIRARSELWFRTIQPKAGDTETYYRFELNTMTWQKTVVKYEGKKALHVGGKEMSCHVVSVNEMKSYLDEEGLPVRIEVGPMVMVREG
ncbi:MAG: hypothetical protein KatS3mg015_1370 [Fimbriimonadales bacterium]|nr:MAG: hypothetical protein KatS3mg015_1370 [Fimbriimonadales bacterium]